MIHSLINSLVMVNKNNRETNENKTSVKKRMNGCRSCLIENIVRIKLAA